MASKKYTIEGNYKQPKVKMNTDAVLCHNLQAPLSSVRSGRFIVIAGSPGSGKSHTLVNLFQAKKNPKTGEQRSFKKCFHKIFLVSPSLRSFANGSVFDAIPDEHKFEDLPTFLENLDALLAEDNEDNSLEFALVMDDIGDSMRTIENLNKMKKLINNRRHKKLTIFSLNQELTQLSPGMRKGANIIIVFQPKTIAEKKAIFEFTGLPMKEMDNFFNSIFTDQYDSLLIDTTQSRGRGYEFYKNIFNRVHIE